MEALIQGDPTAEAWVRRHALTILNGGAARVAGTIRRAATRAGHGRLLKSATGANDPPDLRN